MGMWRFIGSTAESAKRNLPNPTPVKHACINSYTYGTAAFTKVGETVATPVKSACRNSYKRGSAALARTIGLRRRAAEGVETERNELDVMNSQTSSCANADFGKMGQAGPESVKSAFKYGVIFMTFVKIGYTVRVKVFYRISHWISDDGTKSVVAVYTTNIAENAELYESMDGHDLMIGQAVEMPVTECRNSMRVDNVTFTTTGQAVEMPVNECRNSTRVFLTFAKIGYVARVNCFYRIRQWMADDDTKCKIRFYTTKFAENAYLFARQDGYNLIPGGVALLIILSNTFNDVKHENEKLSKDKKAGSNNEHESLQDDVRVFPMNELLLFIVSVFTALMGKEAFRSQFLTKGVFTEEPLVFMMRDFCVFSMKLVFGSQFSWQIEEAVEAIMRVLLSTDYFKDMGLHEPSMKGNKKKKKKGK